MEMASRWHERHRLAEVLHFVVWCATCIEKFGAVATSIYLTIDLGLFEIAFFLSNVFKISDFFSKPAPLKREIDPSPRPEITGLTIPPPP